MDRVLRARLLEMDAEDARLRAELAAGGAFYTGYDPRMAALHAANAHALEAALDEGWPGASRVGEAGAEAAWRIAQHAIGLPQFQRRCFALLQEAAARGETPAWQAAYLDDRIRTLEGRKQIYGTQFDWDERGEMSPLPIEDEAHVDERRARLGLMPLADAIVEHRNVAAQSGEFPPPDGALRQKEFEAWARQVGWRA